MCLSAKNPPFVFVSDPTVLATPEEFLLRIAKGIETKHDLLLHYERAGNFPSYFGRNWDALQDCLGDFFWQKQKRIVIAHDDLPLANQEDELRIYLEILATAVKDWKGPRPGPFVEISSEEWPYIEHELVVAFPSAVEATVVRVLGPQERYLV